ncbi:unnamed protein product (macronuclear) [Paramecium tetraurelia]|uniref:EF-hand domain-containing protein n=1 Tax=Paramecium tetraurelia TaxID=5888 RepID=A0CFG3_PARTE|nr:uncharacterized protein GSPATT00037969001 [Paramecium tetraurelia]CAK69530.1 unnamed protein product [Paramecium tetraurelia]|eukprot:XP_001436927.1 hypothetical protein (macronuclear) [Paramecium tetraurelia strain d4-2]
MNVEQILQGLNPNTTNINLEFRQLDSINHLVENFARFQRLKYINLQGNNLTQLSNNLAILYIEELDVSQNPLDFEIVIKQLQQLSKLTKLHITIKPEEAQIIQENLPQLRFLNNREINPVVFKQKELEQYAIQFEKLIEITKDDRMRNLFDEHVKNVMKDLSLRLSKDLPVFKAKTHVLRAKYALQELNFNMIIEYAQSLDQKVGAFFQMVHDDHANIFKELTNIILSQDAINPVSQYIEKLEKQEYLIKQLESDLQEQQQTIQMCQEENQKYLDLIIRHGKASYDSKQPQQNLQQQQQQALKPTNKRIDTSAIKEKSLQSSLQNEGSLLSTAKLIPLKQLKEQIQEIYDSKAKYDQKCQETKQARETMEQHMYTFLNQKYGLKNIIIEQASTIIQSVKRLSQEDNDVCVFGKILRNECDEEFRFVQIQVKQTIAELLRMFLRQKNPLKNMTDIKEMWNQKMQNYLSFDECQEIVNYMYNQEDSQVLLQKLNQIKLQGNKLEYCQFVTSILDFQLFTHEKYLQKFLKLFRQVDTEKKGYLTDVQFRQLMNLTNLNLSEDEIIKFMCILDPFNTQQMTFSSIVSLLSSVGRNQVTLLQKIQ